ncbi:bifunctional biotin--[acetyl-CoA-carboxylase] ligase/biotin operon repressor BirA [Vibrio sp. SCSIO 43137]|uniref:bifunctional biotin--[acetyl-CoA-carboxylase] ligase/biotin operon repressor BirA n=1 Tax=Vibrio sp. SCSIO 43137 TaxID=3021011 RepID=UPI002307DF37|nr:bifunctional biotin--[acetyl-CoA-carboxylase] ligase/biotin operon repressor BirA [Vibrio sp. SCSIO 43137]WCE29585.1 bifunctional biotin--[acetyl-CoA-carboxylase] ligase/biotin operon repressor BirA [Vibrio sp. SCSIO 43137]
MREHAVKQKIIKLLSDGQFISGEEAGQQLNISRAAISKHIKGLSEWGLDIYRVHGRGYKLAKPLQLLEQGRLSEATSLPVELIPVIDSTNQYLLERVENLTSGSVCIAEYQTQGRGRRGRQWVSPFGSNLYLSMYWRLDAGMAAAMGLSLIVGVAIAEALEQQGISGVKLKWPNDLYINDRKLAGILVEMSGQAGGAAHLVIGMGLNVAMPENTAGIDQPWVSLEEMGEVPERNQLASALINAWKLALEEYEQRGMTGFVSRWNRLDNFLDRPVRLLLGPREISGIARGINEQGALLLETEQGIESFIGGEISLRAG